MWRIAGLVLAGMWFASCKGQKKPVIETGSNPNTLLWQISGNGLSTPSYLFGTFHLICKDDVKFGANVTAAMKATEEVYFEMDLDDPSTLLGGMLYINMADGKSISDFYSEAEYKKMKDFFMAKGFPLQGFSRMKPMLLESLLYPSMLNCKNMTGVEQELMIIAKAQKKDIKGFETIQEQTAVFDSIPYEVQAQSLLKTVDSFAAYRATFDSMLMQYKAQKLDGLMEGIESDTTMARYSFILLEKRNNNWIDQMKKLLPKKALFMAVGAGHLVGEKGLLTLLRKEGFTVLPVPN